MSKSHGSRPFGGQLRNQRIKTVYLILMMGANFGTGLIASEANVACWHEADVRRLPGSSPLTDALPTFGAQCRLTAAFQTQRQAVPKVAV